MEILSGVYEGKTTGTPIALLNRNVDQRSKDYAKIATRSAPGTPTTRTCASTIETHGRHDPCVGTRATPIAEAFLALVLIDHALRHRGQNEDVKAIVKAIKGHTAAASRSGGEPLEDPDPLEA